MKLTAPQAAALAYVAHLANDRIVGKTPRRDVLRRLKGLGLVDYTLTADRPRGRDRWAYGMVGLCLTDAGKKIAAA